MMGLTTVAKFGACWESAVNVSPVSIQAPACSITFGQSVLHRDPGNRGNFLSINSLGCSLRFIFSGSQGQGTEI